MLAFIRSISLLVCATIAMSLKADNCRVLIQKELLKNGPSLQIELMRGKCYSKAPFFIKSRGRNVLDTILRDEKESLLSAYKAGYIIDSWSKSTNVSFITDLANTFEGIPGLNILALPLVESDTVKIDNVRPADFYGKKSSNRYLDYFVGKTVRNLHIPLSLSGERIVTLTHAQDNVNLASAVNINCGRDCVIFNKGICMMDRDAIGTSKEDIKPNLYDPQLCVHEYFPFRREAFITSPLEAKERLGWDPRKGLGDDIRRKVSEYEADDCEKKLLLDDFRADVEMLASKEEDFVFA